MSHKITREQLYKEAWLRPLREIAKDFNVSDVAVGKACKKNNIPRPAQGHWAKLKAGKPTKAFPLSPRFPGALDIISIGGSNYYHNQNYDLSEPISPLSEYDESIEELEKRIIKMVGKVTVPSLKARTHPLISKLLEQDEERRLEYISRPYSWHKPKYDSKLEKRRLRIWNAIFLACAKHGCRAYISTSKYAESDQSPSITVGEQSVSFSFEPEKKKHSKNSKSENNYFSLSISTRYDKPATFIWLDNEETRIEKSMTDIIVKIILSGEIQHRHAIQQQHEWAIERRNDLIEEERLRVEEEKRLGIELREKQEKDRVDKLLFEAESLQKAVTIRNYVNSILESSDRIEATQATIEDWAKWALIQADRIDPVKNLAFLDMSESHSESL